MTSLKILQSVKTDLNHNELCNEYLRRSDCNIGENELGQNISRFLPKWESCLNSNGFQNNEE